MSKNLPAFKHFLDGDDPLWQVVYRRGGCLRKEACIARERLRHEPYRAILRYYKRNAKIREIPWELEESEFAWLIQQNCYYCGAIPIQRKIGFAPYNGIDRTDNGNYTFANCVPCCSSCNWAKNRMNEKEFYMWIKRTYDNLVKKGVVPNV